MTASGFTPGERVGQYWSSATRPGAAGTADNTGTVVIKRKVPDVPAGAVTLRLVGATSGHSDSVGFTVTAAGPAATSGALGTSTNTIPFCTPHTLAETSLKASWTLTVTGVNRNASQVAQGAPQAGFQFVTVVLRATFQGESAEGIFDFLEFNVVGGPGVTVASGTTAACGTVAVPDELPNTDVAPGGTIAGNICFSVSSSDASLLTALKVTAVQAQPLENVYFSLTP